MEETFNDLTPIEKKENTNIFNYLLEKLSRSKPYDDDTQDLINHLKNLCNFINKFYLKCLLLFYYRLL